MPVANSSCFVTIQNNIVLKLAIPCIIRAHCFVTIQNNIVLKPQRRFQLKKQCFVTIQNNIVLKLPNCHSFFRIGFVTIQNNIVLKLNNWITNMKHCFVTIQNNIVLKPQSLKNVILNAITIHILQNHCPYIKYVRMTAVVHILHVPMLIRSLHYTQHTYIFQPVLLFQSNFLDLQI